jgi:tRNA-2-methylthio-N6-dimethylallyladenosine synthase
MIGTRQLILVEGASSRDAAELSGRTGNNRVINFQGSHEIIGRFVEATVTAARRHSLRGEISVAA